MIRNKESIVVVWVLPECRCHTAYSIGAIWIWSINAVGSQKCKFCATQNIGTI